MANGTKIKCSTKSKGYSIVNNVLLRDTRLTPKARFVGIYMLALGDEWEYNLTGLVKVIGSIGKSSLREAVHELEQYGYLYRKQARKAKGRYAGYDYYLVEEPIQNEIQPSSENRTTVNRTTDNRTTNNRTQLIINKTNYESYCINNISNLVDACQKLKLSILPAQIEKLVKDYSLEQVAKGIQYGIIAMPQNHTNAEGFVVYAIKNGFSLTADEQAQLQQACLTFRNQKAQELAAIAAKEAEDENANKERADTCAWWSQLSHQAQANYWQLMLANLDVNQVKMLRKVVEPPTNLTELNGYIRYTAITTLINLRKEEGQ